MLERPAVVVFLCLRELRVSPACADMTRWARLLQQARPSNENVLIAVTSERW
jgi:hypothetical protein